MLFKPLYIQIFKMAAMLQQQYVVLLQNLEIGLPVEVIYTNCGGGLYQIYKPEAKMSVYRSDINLLRGLYII